MINGGVAIELWRVWLVPFLMAFLGHKHFFYGLTSFYGWLSVYFNMTVLSLIS